MYANLPSTVSGAHIPSFLLFLHHNGRDRCIRSIFRHTGVPLPRRKTPKFFRKYNYTVAAARFQPTVTPKYTIPAFFVAVHKIPSCIAILFLRHKKHSYVFFFLLIWIFDLFFITLTVSFSPPFCQTFKVCDCIFSYLVTHFSSSFTQNRDLSSAVTNAIYQQRSFLS